MTEFDNAPFIHWALSPFDSYFYYGFEHLGGYLSQLAQDLALPFDMDEVAFYDQIAQGISDGWLRKVTEDLAIVQISPLTTWQFRKNAAAHFNATQKQLVQNCFANYYTDMATDIAKLRRSADISDHDMARSMVRYEFHNLKKALLWKAATEGRDIFIASALRIYLEEEQKTEDWLSIALAMEAALNQLPKQKNLSYYIAHLDDIGNTYIRLGQFSDARRYFEKALHLFRTEDTGLLPQFEAALLNSLGKCMETFSDSLEQMEASLHIAREKGSPSQLARYAYNLSELLFKNGRFTESQTYLDIAEPIFRQSKDHDSLIKLLQSRAEHAEREQDFEPAENHLKEALKWAKKHHDTATESILYQSLASLYWSKSDFTKALRHCKLALNQFLDDENWAQAGNAFNLLSVLSFQKGELADGVEYANEALRYFYKAGNTEQMIQTYNNLGLMCYKQEWYEEGIREVQKALELCEQIGNRHEWARNAQLLAASLLKMGKYAECQPLLEKALNIFIRLKNTDEIERSFKMASLAAELSPNSSFLKAIQEATNFWRASAK